MRALELFLGLCKGTHFLLQSNTLMILLFYLLFLSAVREEEEPVANTLNRREPRRRVSDCCGADLTGGRDLDRRRLEGGGFATPLQSDAEEQSLPAEFTLGL